MLIIISPLPPLGIWGVGVATQKANLNHVPMGRDAHSLVLRHDGTVYHNNEERNRLPANSLPQEGDVVVSFCGNKALQGQQGNSFKIIKTGCSAAMYLVPKQLQIGGPFFFPQDDGFPKPNKR